MPGRVVENLAYDPPVGLLVDDQQVWAARVSAGADLGMLDEIGFHGLAPGLRVPPGVRVELPELLPPPAGSQLHPAKQRITNQHPEGPRIGCHRRGALVYWR